MLGDAQEDALLESEFADEYQDWLSGRPFTARAASFDYPVRKLARGQPLCVQRGDSVAEVARLMRVVRVGSALVVDDGEIAGIFTEHDVLARVVAEGRDPSVTRVGEVMTEAPEVLHASATVAQALRLLAQGHYRHVPLVDDRGCPVGMLSTGVVIAFVTDIFPKEIWNAPPEAAEPIRAEEGA